MNICIVSLYKDEELVATSGTFATAEELVTYLNALDIGEFTETTCPYDVDIIFECCEVVNPAPEPPEGTFTGDSALNPIELVKDAVLWAKVIPPCTDADSLTYSIVGTLPSGISFNTTTRTFSGTYTGACPTTFEIVMRCSDGTWHADVSIFFNATCATLPEGLYLTRNATSIMYIVDTPTMALANSFSVATTWLASLQSDANYIYGINNTNTVIYKYAKADGSLIGSYTHSGWTVISLYLDGSLLYFVEDTTSANQIVVRKLTASTMLIAAWSTTQAVTNASISGASMAVNATYLFVAVDGIVMRITKTTMVLAGSNITATGIGTATKGALAYNSSDSHVYVAGATGGASLARINASTWTVANTQAPGTSWGMVTYVSGVGLFATEVTGGNTIIQKLSTTLVRTSLYTMGSTISSFAKIVNDWVSIYVPTSVNSVIKVNATTGVLWGTYSATLILGVTV